MKRIPSIDRRSLVARRYSVQRRGPRIRHLLQALLPLLLGAVASEVQASKLLSVSVLDKDYVVVHLNDGDVTPNESGGVDTVTRYNPAMSTSAAAQIASWTLKSSQDPNYGTAGKKPLNCYRKTKLSGHGQMEWVSTDYRYEYTYQHWIFLRLPTSLQQGMSYTLDIASAVNSDVASRSFTFDIYNSRSEAIHVNLVGYVPAAPHKAADLYYWMGDGGERDYSSFEGNTVYLYDVSTGQAQAVGLVTFWKASGGDVFGYNLTRSDVWNADFSGFTDAGTYRLVIDGVGASQDFKIGNDAYVDPFRVSVRGYYYMRIGQDPGAIQPPTRTPLYLPGTSPANTKVYLTEMQPWHPSWGTFSSGDVWDRPDDWAAYRKAGNPTNPNAWGGHSDAADWDRHLGHVSSIYDMLLPYILTNGAISDDATGIAESGNGIPDIIDEARNEVDLWLRLRDGAGYSHGLTNPNANNELFQAGPTAIAAWANAANAAMLADALRIAGQTTLMTQYRDAAVTAYNYANGLADPMLDATQNLGDANIRGRDLKMMAAAYLYNVTGNQTYESVVNTESVCTSGSAVLDDGNRNQVWGTAGYLRTPQTVHFPSLWNNMKASMINEAKNEEANLIDVRPSRRGTDDRTGYFRTAQNMQRSIIAHAVTTDPAEQDLFRKALTLEADWGLGRNPGNFIEMTTAFTPLSSKRSPVNAYTSGRNDGVAGVHPGHTPYFNLDDWYTGMTMGRPSALYENGYPGNFRSTWPIGEGDFNTRWVWAHSEFTPQQTMRGKMALYGYLLGISGTAPPNPTLTVGKSGTGSGTVTSSPAGINCGSTCSASYASGTNVTLTASPAAGSTFGSWSGACSGTGSCAVTMNANQSVTATFNAAPTRTTYGNNGNPWAIASTGTTRIQAENYDTGGEGVAYHDSDTTNSGGQYRSDAVDIENTTDAGGGTNVGWIVAGEWLEYTVSVAAAGTYDVKLRVARQPTGTSAVAVLFGGADKTGNLTVPSTGGWQAWTDLTKTGVSLSAGQQILRIAMVGRDFNVNWIEITAATPTYALTVGKAGTGSGTVTSSPAGINCGGTCTASYNSGTSVTLTAAAASGSTFAGWSGACTGTGACTVSMTAARSVTATFNTTTYTLTVTKAGTGTGTVTSSPAGISCGSTCAASYNSGTSVALTAAAASGSTFAGWSGACAGTGTCSVTMSAARSVTASFNTSVPVVTIYGDALASDWSDWSWSATINLSGTSPVKVGSRAANVTYQAWGGFSPRKGTALGTAGYAALKFWVHGGTGSSKSLRFYTQAADTSGTSTVVIVTAVANAWTEVTVPLSALGNPASIKRLNIQNNSGSAQPMVTFDDIRLVP